MNRNSTVALIFHSAFIAFLVAPLVVVILVAFTPEAHLSVPVHGLSLRWFWMLLENAEFLRSFAISLALAFVSATVALVVMLPASFALGRSQFFGRDALAAFFLSPLMIPSVVLGIACLRFLTAVHLSATFYGLVLSHALIVSPYVLRLSLAAVVGLDVNHERAASSLGASRWDIFWRIHLPLVKPGLISGWILAFITSFDELTVTVFVASPSTTTLPVRLFNRITESTDPLVASVSTVMLLFAAAVMIILDRLYGVDKLFMRGGKA